MADSSLPPLCAPKCPNGHAITVEQVTKSYVDAGQIREERQVPEVLCDDLLCRYSYDGQLPEDLEEEVLDFFGFNP